MNDSKFITIKMWRVTYRAAKILAAQNGVTLVELIHRLVTEETDRASVEAYAAAHPRKEQGQ